MLLVYHLNKSIYLFCTFNAMVQVVIEKNVKLLL